MKRNNKVLYSKKIICEYFEFLKSVNIYKFAVFKQSLNELLERIIRAVATHKYPNYRATKNANQ